MPNPNFIPDYSTNHIFVNLSQNRCLTDDLDDMNNAIEALSKVIGTEDAGIASLTEVKSYLKI